jgi:inner membrane protein
MEAIAYLVLITLFFVAILGLILLLKKIFPNILEKLTAPSYGQYLEGFKKSLTRGQILSRLIFLALMTAILFIPLSMIQNLVSDRQSNYDFAVNNIASTWGGSQILVGPILIIPYTVIVPTEVEVEEEIAIAIPETSASPASSTTRKVNKKVIENREVVKSAAVLPQTLDIVGRLTPEKRARGIYEVLVYTNSLKFTGSFLWPNLNILSQDIKQIHWNEAAFVVGLSDTSSFQGVSYLTLGANQYSFIPGTNNSPLMSTGFSAEVNLTGVNGPIPFTFDIQIAGFNNFQVASVAEKTTMELTSSWPHPSFIGHGLPFDRTVSDDGFTGRWSIPNLVRNYPQIMEIQKIKGNTGEYLQEYLVGVSLFEPIDIYKILHRSIKYAIMFIGLSFLSFFLFEIKTAQNGNQSRLNFSQYGIIGLALALFYLVVLALAEHIGISKAYLAASVIDISMISGYTYLTIKKGSAALLIGSILSFLYGTLYIILNEEDLALVSGTALLVVALGALMLVTRNTGSPDAAPALPLGS